jgi:hypothetical protein
VERRGQILYRSEHRSGRRARHERLPAFLLLGRLRAVVVVVERWRVHWQRLEGRRRLYGRMVGAEAAGASRRAGKGRGRGELARRGGCILLAAAERRQRGEGVGGLVRRRLGKVRLRHGWASVGGCGPVVEERVDAAHRRRRVGGRVHTGSAGQAHMAGGAQE